MNKEVAIKMRAVKAAVADDLAALIEKEFYKGLSTGSGVKPWPKKRTGRLARSIATKVLGTPGNINIGIDGAHYALFLDEGTQHILPFRFIEEVKRKVIPQINALIEKRLREQGFTRV